MDSVGDKGLIEGLTIPGLAWMDGSGCVVSLGALSVWELRSTALASN